MESIITASNSKYFSVLTMYCSMLIFICLLVNITNSDENLNVVTENNEGQMTTDTGKTAINDMPVASDIGNIAGSQEPGENNIVTNDEHVITPENTNTDNSETRSETPPVVTIAEDMRLTQLDPVEIGYVRQMELEPGKFYDVKTMAINPPIFVIPNFLTLEESDRIRSKAEKKGLHASRTVLRESVDKSVDTHQDPYYNKETFEKFDEDSNQYLSVSETRKALAPLEGLELMFESTFVHFVDIVLDLDSDQMVSELEFRRIPLIMAKITDWVAKHHDVDSLGEEVRKRIKTGPNRISHQVWMQHHEYDDDKILSNRLTKLTGLHPDIIRSSEQLQVVHYTPGGHYHAHHDSTEFIDGRPCAHTAYLYPKDPHSHLVSSRICRYITVLYYLANTEEGGETAFPAADNETFSEEAYVKDNVSILPTDLSSHCKDANLYLQPNHLTAVMWYNHYLDKEKGWLGDRNLFALHGGCDVIKGEKWIANNWITVDNNYEMQMKFHYDQLHKPKEVTENNAEIKPTVDVKEDGKAPPTEGDQPVPHDDVNEGTNLVEDNGSIQGHQEL